MTADPLVIRWESLFMAIGALALAVWAFRSPFSTEAAPAEALSSAALQVVRPGRPVEVVEVSDGATLGRGRECDVVFDDSTVSKAHARLRLEAGAASIEDLDSTNGTLLNGARVAGMAALRRGDRIDLGTNQIVYLGAPAQDEAVRS
jgi:pSer/pThr/pTyr-binding forkhead associated (FHA) protein